MHKNTKIKYQLTKIQCIFTKINQYVELLLFFHNINTIIVDIITKRASLCIICKHPINVHFMKYIIEFNILFRDKP